MNKESRKAGKEGMTQKQLIRRLMKLSPPGVLDLSAVLIAADANTPERELRRTRLKDLLSSDFLRSCVPDSKIP
jgi:hypothetical protein